VNSGARNPFPQWKGQLAMGLLSVEAEARLCLPHSARPGKTFKLCEQAPVQGKGAGSCNAGSELKMFHSCASLQLQQGGAMANVFTEGSKVWAPDYSVAWEEGVVNSVAGDSITVSVGADPKKQKQVRRLSPVYRQEGQSNVLPGYCFREQDRGASRPVTWVRSFQVQVGVGRHKYRQKEHTVLATSVVELQLWVGLPAVPVSCEE